MTPGRDPRARVRRRRRRHRTSSTPAWPTAYAGSWCLLRRGLRLPPRQPGVDHRGPTRPRQRGVRLQPPQAAGRGDAGRAPCPHPELEQVVLRIGTILGPSVRQPDHRAVRRHRLLKIRGSESPFVFIWDTDVAAGSSAAVTDGLTGIFNVAGDGAHDRRRDRRAPRQATLTLPEPVLRRSRSAGGWASPCTGRSRRSSSSSVRCSTTPA